MDYPLIRPVKNSDIDQVVELCAKHAKYENASYEKKGKASRLKKALFKTPPSLFCFVAEKDGQIIGYSTITKEFSTWDADYFLHMDCLYILEDSRGLGLGTMFINTIKKFCVQSACTHIQWQTPSDNIEAIKFYNNQGAIRKNKKRFFLNCG